MIGMIGAMEIEVKDLIGKMKNVSTHDIGALSFYKGELEGKEVVAAKCGAGKVNAAMCAQAMILAFNPAVILNVGVAGGIAEGMKICDCVVAESVCQHDVDLSPLGDPAGLIPKVGLIHIPCDPDTVERLYAAANRILPDRVFLGAVATGDCFVNGAEKTRALAAHFSAIACEMEGGAIGQVCYLHEIPFGVLRTISDGGDEESHFSFAQFAARAAAFSSAVMIDFVKNM